MLYSIASNTASTSIFSRIPIDMYLDISNSLPSDVCHERKVYPLFLGGSGSVSSSSVVTVYLYFLYISPPTLYDISYSFSSNTAYIVTSLSISIAIISSISNGSLPSVS